MTFQHDLIQAVNAIIFAEKIGTSAVFLGGTEKFLEGQRWVGAGCIKKSQTHFPARSDFPPVHLLIYGLQQAP